MNTITDNRSDSVLKTLRSLMPARPLTYGEALQIAERQANRLLSLHQLAAPAVPIEILTEQPRIRVVQSYDLPASGSAHWDGQDWVITLNASEYDLRQRYTLCHEYKHLLDHPVRRLQLRLAPGSSMSSADAAERVADYFAACVLMPKAWVKHEFFTGTQNIEQLASRFEVSAKAMSYRLHELGLTRRADRCWPSTGIATQNGMSRRASPTDRPYQRTLSTDQRQTITGVQT